MIEIIVGTNRPGSNSKKIASQIPELFQQGADGRFKSADLVKHLAEQAEGFTEFMEKFCP